MRLITSLLLILLVAGCANTPAPPRIELPWPTPMQPCIINSVRIDSNGDVVLSYQDNINIAVCERDMFRYIKDLTKIICVHQPNQLKCKDSK